MTPTELRALLSSIPKIELHRHLEGALRLSTLVEIARQHKLDVPGYTADDLRPHVQIMPDSPATVEHFLSKFAVLRKFYCAPQVIYRVAYEAVEDAALDNIRYMELRFTPKTLTRAANFALSDVVEWVCEAVADAQRKFDIKVRLIVSMNRHEGPIEAERVVRVALQYRERGIVALDLAGQEEGFPANPFAGMFREAKQAGMHITLHAGEWAGPSNIRFAVEQIGATRIGHGVRIVEDDRIVQIAREYSTVFEVCPTSNLHSGVIREMNDHPLREMDHLSLRTTLNTDDPGISAITLTDELYLAVQTLGLPLEYIKHSTLTAAQGAFLPDAERKALVEYFDKAITLPDTV